MTARHWEPSQPTCLPPVVLVHGIGVSSRYFRRLAEELARSTRVIALDLPGFGPNKRPRRRLSVEAFGALVADYLENIGSDAPILVGHSMGAQIVVETARRLPTEGLVLIGPVVDERAPTALRQGLRLARDGLHESVSSNWIVATDYLRSGIRWYLSELPAMLTYRIEKHLPHVDVPVLVVRGAEDPVAPEGWARALARRSPGARVVSIPGSGHVVQHTASTAVADEITRFAARLPLVTPRDAVSSSSSGEDSAPPEQGSVAGTSTP